MKHIVDVIQNIMLKILFLEQNDQEKLELKES